MPEDDVLLKDGNYSMIMHSPGIKGDSGTVSFQTGDGKWLKEEVDSYLRVRSFNYGANFNEGSTFKLMPNKWFAGTFVFESTVNPGRYWVHSDYKIMVLPTSADSDAERFKNNASYIPKGEKRCFY